MHTKGKWSIMSGAPWNILDEGGARIVWCRSNDERNGEPADIANARRIVDLHNATLSPAAPQPARMPCPYCGIDHIDAGEWETRPHHKHLCLHCGKLFRFEGADGEYFYGVADPDHHP